MTSENDRLITAARQAAEVVDAAGLAADLRPVAFDRILAGLLTEGPPVSPAMEPREQLVVPDRQVPGSRLAQIAKKLGLDTDDAERIYDASRPELELVFSRSKLPTSKSRAARNIAIVYAAGDQAGYERDWTPIGAIREVCKSYGVFDQANFATTVTSAGDALIVRGKGLQREIRITRPGYEEARDLCRDLL